MGLGDGNGSTSHGTILTACDKAVEGCVDGVVPCTCCASHDQDTPEENEVHADEFGDGGFLLGSCVDHPVEVREPEVPIAIGPIEAHLLNIST